MRKVFLLSLSICLILPFSSKAQGVSNTIWDIISNSPEHTSLETLIITANLSEPLSNEGPFTVFAPTDAAIDALPANVLADVNDDPTGALVDLINYHLVDGILRLSDLPISQTIETLNGEGIFIDITADAIFINNTQLTIREIVATNGVVHIIDAVLRPATEIKPTGKILDVIAATAGHTLVANMLASAGLTDELSLRGPFTVFVPTDAAIAGLPMEVINDPTGALAQTLLYHVVPGIAVASRLSDSQMLLTLQGQHLTITRNTDGIFVNSAKIIKTDILTDNGVIHFIDGALTLPTTSTINDDSIDDNETYSCEPVDGAALTTTNIADENLYIYTPQPNGAVNNQFRYRIVTTDEWSETDISNLHYRYLSDLQSGTTYEFQVRQQCDDESYSAYSSSSTFTTTGTPPTQENTDSEDSTETEDNTDSGNTTTETEDNTDSGDSNDNGNNATIDEDCLIINGSSLYTTGISSSAGYIYTPQPLGAINNQFRYRVVGTTNWMLSEIATTYYRYLTELSANTTYEYQVRQECAANSWSAFSESALFTTTTSFQTGANSSPFATNFRTSLVEEELIPSVNLAPNPAVHQLLFSSTMPFKHQAALLLYNNQGQFVKRIPLSVDQQQQAINTAAFSPGIYFLKYQNGLSIQTIKFLKQ